MVPTQATGSNAFLQRVEVQHIATVRMQYHPCAVAIAIVQEPSVGPVHDAACAVATAAGHIVGALRTGDHLQVGSAHVLQGHAIARGRATRLKEEVIAGLGDREQGMQSDAEQEDPHRSKSEMFTGMKAASPGPAWYTSSA